MITDPSIYGAPEFTPVLNEPGAEVAAQYQAPERVSQGTILKGTDTMAVGTAEQFTNARPRASAWDSVKASAAEWGTTRLWENYNGPTFEPEEGHDPAAILPTLGMALSEAEREFLLETQSREEQQFKLERLKKARENGMIAGDSPVLSFVTSMFDPVYLGLDVFAAGSGRLVSAGRAGIGRATAATVGAGGAYGVGLAEGEVAPVSDMELILGSLVNGAAAGAFYSRGKGVQKADPEFPDEVLHNLAEKARTSNPDKGIMPRIEFTAPEGGRTGRELLESIAPTFRGTEYEGLVEALRKAPELDQINVSTGAAAQAMAPKARGFMARKGDQNLLFVREGVEADVPLHELVHAVLQPRLLANPKMAAELRTMGAAVVSRLARENTDASRFLVSQLDKNVNEFIAYAFTSPTFRKWAQQTEIAATGEPRSVEAFQRANSPVFKDPNAGIERPGYLPAATVWERLIQWVADKLGLKTPRDRAALRLAMDRQAWDSRASTPNMDKGWTTLDDRLRQMMQQVASEGNPVLYTRGVLKNIDASMDSAEVRRRIGKMADKQTVGQYISWSLHKTLASFSPKAQEIAGKLVDDPLDHTGDSVVSQARAVRADLTTLQFQYEDLLTRELAKQGAGIKNRIFKPREALAVQRKLEKDIQLELLHRERNNRLGLATESKSTPEVKAMADALDKVYAAALKEMQAAGVRGADDVQEASGYFSRKWDISNIDEARTRLMQTGRTTEEADKVLLQIVTQGVRRANGWDAQLSRDIAKAILDRAHRKGYFEDSAFRSHVGNAAAAEVRDILEGAGLRGDRLQRALDVLTAKVDEAGKISALKHRIDIDMKAGIAMPDGTVLTVSDLISSDMTRATEAYLDQVSGRIALARKGLPDVSDVDKLRTELLESIPTVSERGRAAKLFDETINSIMGRPVGEDLPEFMRNMQAVTRMVGLASSGMWQVTEYATAMQRYGAWKTLKAAMKEANFAAVRRADYSTSSQLVDVLSRNSSADIRLRPFINRLEDNFEVPTGSIVQSALLQAQQLVPYLNAQKLVQTHQARTVANLVVDTFRAAGNGDQKAIKALASYGLEPHIVNRIQPELKAAGMDTAKWSDATWAEVRAPLQKMMDDAVLRNRTGEIPAFAQFSQVGKFMFTFRSFVLGAHNKVLAGTISRDGLAGISLLMLYQFPLAVLMTQANSTLQGKTIQDEQELISKAIGQMGVLGLASEIFGVVTGQKQQFGAPGLITIDRLYKLAGDITAGDAGQAASGAIQAMPLISIFPGARAIGEALKD